MPTAGTHITIVQRIAASDPAYAALLGSPDPTLSQTDPDALKMRYACLGAVGPDMFYALADYGLDEATGRADFATYTETFEVQAER